MYRYLMPIMLLLAAPSVAQNCKYIPGNTPTAGICGWIPFGNRKLNSTWRNQKYQTILLASQLGKVPGSICEIAFAPCATEVRNFDSLVIKMNHTKLTSFTGNTNFASNLGTNATTVLSAKNYTWHNTANKWNRIGLQKSFTYIPVLGNVIIDIEIRNVGVATGSQGFHRSSPTGFPNRLHARGWTVNPPATGTTGRVALKIEVCFDVADLSHFGTGCGPATSMASHTLSGSAKVGQTVQFAISGPPPTVPSIALLLLGVNNGAPFPLLLPSTTKCYLFISPDFVFPVTTSSGKGAVKFVMPNLPCVRFYSQYAVLRGSALETTNYGRILIGN